MKLSPIYAALLASFASIPTSHAASVTQNIAENYGATNILPTQRCVDLNSDGPSNFCIANINPEGLSLKPGHKFTVTPPDSFPDLNPDNDPNGPWWHEGSTIDVKIYGADEKRYDCTRIEGNQWSCILPDVGFHSAGLRVYLGADDWRAGWGGMLTVDDLVPDSPEFSNASAEFEQANDKSVMREGKQWLATKTPVQVELEFDLVSGSADSLAADPIHVLVEKSMDTDKPTSEWVVLDNQKVDVVDGHYRVTGEIYPQQGWSSEAFFTLTLGYKLTDNDTPIPFIDPDNKTKMIGQGAYLDASPMRIVDSANPESECVLTQTQSQECDLIANGHNVRLTGVNVWQDADNEQTISVGNTNQTLKGGHVTADVPFEIETTGQKTFNWNQFATVVTYNTDTSQIVLKDSDPLNDVNYNNAYINGAVIKVSNKGRQTAQRQASDTGIRLTLETLDQSPISGLESVTWSARYPLIEMIKADFPDLPSYIEQGLKPIEELINSQILARAVEFSDDGQFYLDIASVNDGIEAIGGLFESYLPRFANIVLPLDLTANYRVNGEDKLKTKRFNVAVGDRGKRIINFTNNGTPRCLTKTGGQFKFQDCDTSQAVNDNTDVNTLFKFVPAAQGTTAHPTNVFQVRPVADDTQCLTVNDYNVTINRCDIDYGVSQLFSFQAQSDLHLEESIITSTNKTEMAIASIANGRVFDVSGGGAGGSVAGDLIVFPKNGDKGSKNQYMYVSRNAVNMQKPRKVPVDLTVHCSARSGYTSQTYNSLSLTASNHSEYDAYVLVSRLGRSVLVRAGESKQIDEHTVHNESLYYSQQYSFPAIVSNGLNLLPSMGCRALGPNQNVNFDQSGSYNAPTSH